MKHGCDYLNPFAYMDDMGLDSNGDFRDATYLNVMGACKVADFLGRILGKKINEKRM